MEIVRLAGLSQPYISPVTYDTNYRRLTVGDIVSRSTIRKSVFSREIRSRGCYSEGCDCKKKKLYSYIDLVRRIIFSSHIEKFIRLNRVKSLSVHRQPDSSVRQNFYNVEIN